MAVSLIESLYMNFGSGIVAEGTGIVLHNRGAYFSTTPGHPNVYTGGKRPVHTLSPPMFLRDGVPEIVFGTMGGDGQPQIQLQFLHQLVDRGLDVQRALDEPRWVYGRPNSPAPRARLGRNGGGRVAHAGRDRRRSRAPRPPRRPLGPYENAMGHAHAIVVDRAARHARRRRRPPRRLSGARVVSTSYELGVSCNAACALDDVGVESQQPRQRQRVGRCRAGAGARRRGSPSRR